MLLTFVLYIGTPIVVITFQESESRRIWEVEVAIICVFMDDESDIQAPYYDSVEVSIPTSS